MYKKTYKLKKYNRDRKLTVIPSDVGYIRDDHALVFDNASSTYLSRTPGSVGNRKKFTFFTARKFATSHPSDYPAMLCAGSSVYNEFTFYKDPQGRLVVYNFTTSLYNFILRTNPVFVDTTATQYIMLVLDTDNPTERDRVQLVVNGVRITDFETETYPSLGFATYVNTAVAHTLGRCATTNQYYDDATVSSVLFVDGYALDTSDVFKFDPRGVPYLKRYNGSFGTNGFLLDFTNAENIGKDTSGNGNDWIPNNFTADSLVADTWSNNYCTLNGVDTVVVGSLTLSNGNRTLSGSRSAARGTVPVTSRDSFWEVRGIGVGSSADVFVGIQAADETLTGLFTNIRSILYRNDGNVLVNGVASAYGDSYTNGDYINCSVRPADGVIEFYKNGVSQGTVALSGIPDADTWLPLLGFANSANNSVASVYFEEGGWTMSPMHGEKSLCTANLPRPLIQYPSQHFNTYSIEHDGVSTDFELPVDISESGYLFWIKRTDGSGSNYIINTLLGHDKYLITEAANAAATDASILSVSGTTASLLSSLSAGDYSIQAWRLGEPNGVANADGTQTSMVSVNTTAKLSTLTFDMPASGIGTVGHGLGERPDFVIAKALDNGAYNWTLWTKDLDNDRTKYLALNLSDSVKSYSTIWGSGITSSVVGVTADGMMPANAEGFMFCGKEVEGFSKVGTYTGNGSFDGPYVYCGFKPAWLMVKRVDSAGDWRILSSARDPFNPLKHELNANKVGLETVITADIHFTANGFKIEDGSTRYNATGGTYVFIAFAEVPFGGKGLYPATAR